VAVLALVLSLVRLPYFVESPDVAHDVEPLIHVGGAEVFPSQGHFLLTAVNFRMATAYDVVGNWHQPGVAIVPQRELIAPGQTQEQEVQVAVSQMDTSKIDAAIVALTGFAGYPSAHRPGALVESVVTGTPADGRLFAGDVVEAVDGERVEGPDDVAAKIRAAGAGHPLRFTVRGRPGGTAQVTVTPAKFPDIARPIIGVSMVQNFPFP
jgi:PDZ domain-containing protein